MPTWLVLVLAVPVACGIIGWITNVIAVKMIFRPREALRFAGLRFQGVLPKHQEHFAKQLAEIITGDFMSTSELVSELDLRKVYQQLAAQVDQTFEQLAGDLKGMLGEGQRAMITDEVLEMVRVKIHEELQGALPEVETALIEHADELVDLTDSLQEKIIDLGPRGLEDIVYHIARRELKFIEYYGGVFGFLIGALQLSLIFVLPIKWELPVVGAIVGIITNYLAIQMLFYPREPRGIGPFKMQGLFPKRQAEIAMAQAEITAEELIIVDEVFAKLKNKLLRDNLDGADSAEAVDPSVVEQIEAELTRRYPAVAATMQAILTGDQQEQFKRVLLERFFELAPQIADEVIRTAAEQIDIQKIMNEKVAALPKLRFEQLLRGLFEQEEFYLVIYGGLLGGMMGFLQLAAVALIR